ncbi:hypothetical protein HDU96_007499 [Phlyctochytrium bullatum]|nr:hypothetical protein HDU96_007499 [Phlyctochytrium bullatum]
MTTTTDTPQPRTITVLFLCTHNSARSQLSEALLRHHASLLPSDSPVHFRALSAGTEELFIRPLALRVMAEPPYNFTTMAEVQSSKTLERYINDPSIDVVVTVCDSARDSCPLFPGAKRRLHWSTRDPSRVEGDEETQLKAYREVRAELEGRIVGLMQEYLQA